MIKKLIITSAVCLLSYIASAQHSQGTTIVGASLNYNTVLSDDYDEIDNFGIGVRFQYYLTNEWVIEPSINTYFKSKAYNSKWGYTDYNVNAQYRINVANQLQLYPTAGLSVTTCRVKSGDWKNKESGLGINLGAGAEYFYDPNLSFNFEIKYNTASLDRPGSTDSYNLNRMTYSLGVLWHF